MVWRSMLLLLPLLLLALCAAYQLVMRLLVLPSAVGKVGA
jgi:hypothetical protein